MDLNWQTTFLPWVNIFFTIFVILVPIYIGQRIGKLAVKKQWNSDEASIGTVVGASLGLLAFMLAFTFQIASNKFDTRKQLYLEQVSNMRQIYLLSSLLPEQQRINSRKSLEIYVNSQVNFLTKEDSFKKEIKVMNDAQKSLWKVCEALAKESISSEIYSLYTDAVTEQINIHNERIAVSIQFRIPKSILYSLYCTAFFSMLALGFQFGIAGKSTHFIKISMALTFASVVWVIIALDNPETRLINVNPITLIEFQKEITKTP